MIESLLLGCRATRWILGLWAFCALLVLGCGSASYAGAPAPQSYDSAGDAMMAEAAVGRAESDSDSPSKFAPGGMAMAPPPPMAPSPAGAKSGGETPQGQPQATAADPARHSPILIYTANFTMSVFEVEKSLEAVDRLAHDAGGYLARRDDHSITVRVPAAKFQAVIAAIEKVGDVLHRNVVSEDVTAEFRDLEVQVQNLLALRSRFEKLLDKAVKVEEALQIERELGRITGEIERIKGRLKLLTDLAQYSTITVSFQPRATESVQEGPFLLPLPWLNDVGLRRLMNL